MKTDIHEWGILYWDGSRLQVGTYTKARGLRSDTDAEIALANVIFAKFGSVVGFLRAGDWAASKVVYNPTTYATSYFATYANIPCFVRTDYVVGKNVSDSAYQNVAAGKGDICMRVAGGGWRLPTSFENGLFVGTQTVFSRDTSVTPNVVTLDTGHELPCLGFRHINSVPTHWGTRALFWSSDTFITGDSNGLGWGQYMEASTIVASSLFGDSHHGFAIRCVRP